MTISDLALLAGAGAGDESCTDELRRRHVAAVGRLADALGPVAVQQGWTRLVQEVRAGTPSAAPARVRWLAATLGAADAGPPEGDDVVWQVFSGLSTAWQTALWHVEVERDDAPATSLLLGSAAAEVAPVVGTAATALRRGIVLRHGGGSSPECREVGDAAREHRGPSLSTAVVRRLREHGRHCDDCLSLYRVQFTLREVLAGHVLGRHATAYLSTGQRSRAVVLAPGRPSAAAAVVRRAGRPSLGVLASGLTAAAVVSAFAISVPQLAAPSPATAAPVAPVSPDAWRGPILRATTSPAVAGRPTGEPVATPVLDERRRGGDPTSSDGAGDGRGPTPGSPAPTDQEPTDQGPTDTGPTPTDPAPTDPDPTTPDPTTPTPTDPDPTDPGPDPVEPPPAPVTSAPEPVVSLEVRTGQAGPGSVEVAVAVPVTGLPPVVVSTPALPLPTAGLLP
jgi:hypothetical protein